MKLNAHILLNELEHIGNCKLGTDYLCRNLSGYTLYIPQVSLRTDTLYLILPENAGDFAADTLRGMTLLFPDCREGFRMPEGNDCICLDGTLSPEEVLLRLEEIFEKYRQWEQDLLDSLHQMRTIDDLCRISLPVFSNPIMVHNSEYELMGCAQAPGIAFTYQLTQEGTNYLNENVTNDLFFRTDYLTALTYREPKYWLDNDDQLLSIYSNIFDSKQEYWGRIVIDEVNRKLNDGYLSLLAVLADAVTILAADQQNVKYTPLAAFKNYALEYLNTPLGFNRDKLLMAMGMAGWERRGTFFCVCMEPTDSGKELNSAAYESILCDNQLHGYLSLECQDSLLLICNMKLALQGRDAECRRIAYIVRENVFKSGISTEFTDFFSFPDYYRQAQAALRSGQECSSTKWLFKFEDYGLHYVLTYGADTLPVQTVIPANILRLLAYDSAHGTSYYQTLENYIEYDTHTAKAIDDLYIHRNTFKSRIKKIRELLDMDIDSPPMRLYLMIVFRILKRYPELMDGSGEQTYDAVCGIHKDEIRGDTP